LSKITFEIGILNVGVIHTSTLSFDRLMTLSEIEGLRTGESPIKYGQFKVLSLPKDELPLQEPDTT